MESRKYSKSEVHASGGEEKTEEREKLEKKNGAKMRQKLQLREKRSEKRQTTGWDAPAGKEEKFDEKEESKEAERKPKNLQAWISQESRETVPSETLGKEMTAMPEHEQAR